MPEKWSDFLLLLLFLLMRIVTLNVHGFRSATKQAEVIRLARAIY